MSGLKKIGIGFFILIGLVAILVGYGRYREYYQLKEIYRRHDNVATLLQMQRTILFFRGNYYLEPNESIEIFVRPNYDQREYSSALILASDQETALSLAGRDVWYEGSDMWYYDQSAWDSKQYGDSLFTYDINQQQMAQYDEGTGTLRLVDVGHHNTTISEGTLQLQCDRRP